MQFGVGRLPEDALLFSNLEGEPLQPSNVSSDWGELAGRIGLPGVTFHSLRHTHASQLIDAGVDIVTVSKRLGHAKPSVTLAVYAHMFTTDDGKAAAAINAALGVSKVIGWQSGGTFTFVLPDIAAKSLKIKPGEVAERLKAAVC